MGLHPSKKKNYRGMFSFQTLIATAAIMTIDQEDRKKGNEEVRKIHLPKDLAVNFTRVEKRGRSFTSLHSV